MSIDDVSHYIRSTPVDLASIWQLSVLTDLATRSVPDIFFRDRATLLRADQSRLWLRWFLEGLATPFAFVADDTKGKIHIHTLVRTKMNDLYPDEDAHSKDELASVITDHLYAEVKRQRLAGRDSASREKKRELVEAADPPRCYLCGHPFSNEAIDALLKVQGRNEVELPKLVDVFRPRLVRRDVSIEIEHIVPVAKGGSGQQNLKLACGWCNRHKSAKTSIYDAAFSASRITFRLGPYLVHELPEPFWLIRLLAMNPRCQHPEGCTADTTSHELFAAPRDWDGSPNPTNIRFFCSTHDPISPHRFIAPSDAEKIWVERSR